LTLNGLRRQIGEVKRTSQPAMTLLQTRFVSPVATQRGDDSQPDLNIASA
jgi:hypothetical protein